MNYPDLAEHTGVLVALLSIFAWISGFLLWRMFSRVERKLDEVLRLCCECQRDMAERFLPKEEFRDEREALWGALNSHSHNKDGRVVR
jgi:hypothetical protein|uniref:Uncharacterized protein n=1 Tax=Desulfobacca acetoxidans TaxID=60893 RepID=A0A7C3WI37_9BACT